jgi:hypothetical protein
VVPNYKLLDLGPPLAPIEKPAAIYPVWIAEFNFLFTDILLACAAIYLAWPLVARLKTQRHN